MCPPSESPQLPIIDTPYSLGQGLIEAGEFRAVMANLGDAFTSEEIGQLMLMVDMNADGKFSIDDIVKYGATYS